MSRATDRRERLMPRGVPRYVRCYDNGGKTFDRFTIVFTGRYAGPRMYVGASSDPFNPGGFGQRGEGAIDYPTYGHLGKKISFGALPERVLRFVMGDYLELWGLS